MHEGWIRLEKAWTSAAAITCALMLGTPLFAQQDVSLRNNQISVVVKAQDGSYEIRSADLERPVLRARVGAEIDKQWVESDRYPKRQIAESAFEDALGNGHQVTVTFSGLAAKPDLVCVLRLYDQLPYGDIEVTVKNGTGKGITIQSIRSVEALGRPVINLGGPEPADRVLSDPFSEDWPELKIYDLAQAPDGLHRGVGSQLIYNRESKRSLFFGALTSRRLLTILHLKVENAASGSPQIAVFTVDSTGTTEIQKAFELHDAPAEDQVELSLPVPAGQSLSSERMLFTAGPDYHAQLEAYAEAVRRLQHARVTSDNLIGWWSWTAFYGGIQEGPTLTNAYWLADHLKPLGYNYFHIDEGYQYARGEYMTPNATQFPDGIRFVGHEVCRLGLNFGIWTAPFEVTGRAWVYEHHKDWLVHNARGEPIRIGFVGRGHTDPLYALDTTHPGAQEYLRQTYHTLAREWGVRYIKLDFMDTTAIEGYHYKPNTTALEAQRLGLTIIREAVGDDVRLDKDGSPMLNPVGIVDEGRISVDTGHSFVASKEAVPGIAARYYMHRTWFVNDPDAFTVAGQLIPRQGWHQSRTPISLSDAQVSIALSAVSGGMFEEGDDLPLLGAQPDRLALVENPDLLQMAKLSRVSFPLDLMTYRSEDEMPSLFLLKEDRRVAVLTVFNWTDEPRSHSFTLSDLNLRVGDSYQLTDVFDRQAPVGFSGGTLALENMPPHSVRMIKIIDTSVEAAAPTVTVQAPDTGATGDMLKFTAQAGTEGVPAVSYHWDWGDGTASEGREARHAYTEPGTYTWRLKVDGVDGVTAEQSLSITASGLLRGGFDLEKNRRFVEGGKP